MKTKNEIENEVLNMRHNEFALRKVSYIDGRDTFPYEIAIVKEVQCEPFTAYSLDEAKYVTRTSYTYVVAHLKWNSKEPCWEFSSVGTRYLADGDTELNKWLLNFCGKYFVDEDGNLQLVSESDFDF